MGEVEEKENLTPLIEDVKRAIIDFCEREYQDDEYTYDSFNALYPDLAHIGIAYTTTPDNEHEIQYEISLENYTATQYIDNKPISKTNYIEQYGSKKKALENIKLELEMFEFTDFVSINEDD